jgi:hypothetical protein
MHARQLDGSLCGAGAGAAKRKTTRTCHGFVDEAAATSRRQGTRDPDI